MDEELAEFVGEKYTGDGPPTGIDRVLRDLRWKHAGTAHGSQCDDYDPSTHSFDDHVCVYCGTCQVVLGKVGT